MTNRGHLISVDQIAEMLRARMRELPEAWGLTNTPGARFDGNDFVCCNPLRADREAGSFRICVRGSHRGLIKDFAGGSWSALKFTADLMFGGNQAQAVEWAKRWLGIDGRDPGALQQTRAMVAQAEQEDRAEDEREAKVRGQAQQRYLQSQERVIDTPVDGYLRGRGIDLMQLPFAERWFRGVRYHPNLYNRETDARWPAMVASIVADDGSFLGIHRTWLAIQPDGGVVKAPLADNKKSYGRFQGRNGLIRVWGGVRQDPATGEMRRLPKWRAMKPGAEIHLTEGIEDALSVAVAIPEARVAAGISLDNMVALTWPEAIGTVVVWRQNDAPDSPASRRMERLVENYRRQGKRVVLPTPPSWAKDVNDVVRAAMGAAAPGKNGIGEKRA